MEELNSNHYFQNTLGDPRSGRPVRDPREERHVSPPPGARMHDMLSGGTSVRSFGTVYSSSTGSLYFGNNWQSYLSLSFFFLVSLFSFFSRSRRPAMVGVQTSECTYDRMANALVPIYVASLTQKRPDHSSLRR